MRCASVRCRQDVPPRSGEEGLGDLLGGQPAHLAQGERNLRFRRQQWMAAGKNQAQPVVFKAVLFILIGPVRRTRLRFEIAHQLVLRRIESCPPPQRINGFEPGRRNQPWPRVIGHSTGRPHAQRSRKGFVHRLLGQIKIAHQADQRSQNPSRIHAIKRVEQLTYRLIDLLARRLRRDTLGHDTLQHNWTLANPLPRINLAHVTLKSGEQKASSLTSISASLSTAKADPLFYSGL